MRPAIAFIAVTTVFGSLLGLRLWQQRAELNGPAGGAGVVEGTSILVSSRLSARVTQVAVHEGQQVEAGALLLTLDCAEAEAGLAEAAARLEVTRAQAEAASASAQASRRTGSAAARQAAAAAAQASALATQRESASKQADRLEALGADVPADRRDTARAQATGLEAQAEGAVAARQASAEQAAASQEQGKAALAQADAALDAIKGAEAALTRAQLLVGECQVKAPAPGFIETLPWQVGELVPPGATLARLVDIREVKATFYLPNAELSAVSPGAAAEIEADAWPEERFEGTVSTVSLTAEFTPRNIQTRSDRDRLVYPIEVRIPNADGRLRPGMPVQVTLPGTGS